MQVTKQSYEYEHTKATHLRPIRIPYADVATVDLEIAEQMTL